MSRDNEGYRRAVTAEDIVGVLRGYRVWAQTEHGKRLLDEAIARMERWDRVVKKAGRRRAELRRVNKARDRDLEIMVAIATDGGVAAFRNCMKEAAQAYKFAETWKRKALNAATGCKGAVVMLENGRAEARAIKRAHEEEAGEVACDPDCAVCVWIQRMAVAIGAVAEEEAES